MCSAKKIFSSKFLSAFWTWTWFLRVGHVKWCRILVSFFLHFLSFWPGYHLPVSSSIHLWCMLNHRMCKVPTVTITEVLNTTPSICPSAWFPVFVYSCFLRFSGFLSFSLGRGKSVCELGGGMTCLAGVTVRLCCLWHLPLIHKEKWRGWICCPNLCSWRTVFKSHAKSCVWRNWIREHEKVSFDEVCLPTIFDCFGLLMAFLLRFVCVSETLVLLWGVTVHFPGWLLLK